MCVEECIQGDYYKKSLCWSHRASALYSPTFFDSVEKYNLRFNTTGINGGETFLDQWKALFRDTFTYALNGDQATFVFDKSKYATLANMYGVMGALRLLEEAPYYIRGYLVFDEKYGDKLNPFQKLLLGHYHPVNGSYFNTNHEFFNGNLMLDGKLTLKYFSEPDIFVDRVLGKAIDPGSLKYGVIKGMSTAVYDDMGYEGAPKWLNGACPAGEFTTIVSYQGRKAV
jgi:hypothetical protein